MKLLKISAATVAILAAALSMAMAGTFTRGTVKKVDEKAGKVTIIHEELVDLDMPAMTMVFRADEEMISRMSEGQDIEFVADRVNGKLTVIELK
ncbi:copper-binding protein [Sedimentitalea xiamensis]|uniref:copper-binding protein n=1 Tax=Sedimentitalea xiamensis TaxID=3050037 RepID=UPI002AA2AEBB|nr:copper-binding protein [Sedimentitalea xiamensis]